MPDPDHTVERKMTLPKGSPHVREVTLALPGELRPISSMEIHICSPDTDAPKFGVHAISFPKGSTGINIAIAATNMDKQYGSTDAHYTCTFFVWVYK